MCAFSSQPIIERKNFKAPWLLVTSTHDQILPFRHTSRMWTHYLVFWGFMTRDANHYLMETLSHQVGFCSKLTKSDPRRKWIPTKGPSEKFLSIKSWAFFCMFFDHLRYIWFFMLPCCTGKLAGAPVKAITLYFSTGNLKITIIWNKHSTL